LRLYVGDRQVGEELPTNTTQKIVLRIAQAAGMAIGGAMVHRLMSRFDRKVWGSIKTSGVGLELRTLAQRHAATAR
jgi:hypothetical protein